MTSSEAQPDLLIVIVNYRTAELTVDCLRSLVPELVGLAEQVRVVLVDNGSADGSTEVLRRAIRAARWQAWVELLPLGENVGFAGGNNRGIARYPHARHVLLLNSDTLMHPGTLRHCLDTLSDRPNIGAMACRLLGADGSPQTMARPFPTPLRQTLVEIGLPWWLPRWFARLDPEFVGPGHHRQPRGVDWLGGAFLLLRGAALCDVGLLDERFFFYGEDIELCHRLYRAGWQRWYDPRVTITHFGAGSSDPRRDEQHRSPAFWQARYRVQRLCYGRAAAAWLRTVDLLSLSLRLAAMRCRGRSQTARYRRDATAWRLLRKPLATT